MGRLHPTFCRESSRMEGGSSWAESAVTARSLGSGRGAPGLITGCPRAPASRGCRRVPGTPRLAGWVRSPTWRTAHGAMGEDKEISGRF